MWYTGLLQAPTSLVLEIVEDDDEASGAAVGEPCDGWLRSLVVQDLEVACRLTVRMQKQQLEDDDDVYYYMDRTRMELAHFSRTSDLSNPHPLTLP